MPWRETGDPYEITVSEFMLQQTQVARVMEKYPGFLGRFSNWKELASASRAEVLGAWQGLGYNRRAKFLHETANKLVDTYGGSLPDDPAELVKLPGIGPNTAGSIAAFAFNKPVVFIETNIRRVFLHFFFETEQAVADTKLLPLIEAGLDRENPREWYYALMDYGVELARLFPNPNRRSAHYSRQSRFEGSDRQLRGYVLRELTRGRALEVKELPAETGFNAERVGKVLSKLESEELIHVSGGSVRLVE